MIFTTEDDGIIWTEENNGREIPIVANKDNANTLYYVARDYSGHHTTNKFRSAGIVESFVGIQNLMYWVAGNAWNATGLIEG